MRCKNCGWGNNPAGNVKCEKCNAPLSGSMADERMPTQVRGASDDFNPAETARGCRECGYQLRPTDTVCPNCGRSLTIAGRNENPFEKKPEEAGKNREPDEVEIKEKERPPRRMGGTVIQDDMPNRKKLVGFLVTYSHEKNGLFYPLYEGRSFIGSSPSSEVCIDDDTHVSEKHLSILYRVVDRKFKFKDEQSVNGTFINDQLIDEGELKNNDTIRVGTTRFVFMVIPETAFE